MFKVVSLFSGCGGLDLGFTGDFTVFGKRYSSLPFEIVWANDISSTACETYKLNLADHIHCGDIWETLDEIPKRADVVIGGFPCQDVSINGKMRGVDGGRSGLYRAMIDAISRIKPKVFVAENVKGLLMSSNSDSLKKVISDFEGLGYKVSYKLYLAADYGIPQMRERVFIVGTLPRITAFAPPEPVRAKEPLLNGKKAWMTSREAIADLEPLPESPEFSHIWSRAEKSPEQGNRKIKADRPADTMRAECHGNIQFHYSLPRRISMREAARFQSFPDDFVFAGKLRETERQVGNAVPPVLGWHIAKAVLDCLHETSD
jgi:DNA (cytosine-5)-methyltransferase 1